MKQGFQEFRVSRVPRTPSRANCRVLAIFLENSKNFAILVSTSSGDVAVSSDVDDQYTLGE